LLLLTGLAAVTLFLVLIGCKGGFLSIGKKQNLEQVAPDFVDPPWYDDYQRDRHAAYERYDGTVLQLGVRVTNREDASGNTEVIGTTGNQDLYRASCTFPEAAAASLEDVRVGSYVEVKGLFDHMLETSNSYQIYLQNCVVVNN
jgi:hypothetical protein